MASAPPTEPRTEYDRRQPQARISASEGPVRRRKPEQIGNGSASNKPLKAHLEDLGLEHEERLLKVLRNAGPEGLTPGEAARRAELAPRTYSGVARRLEEGGTIVRHGKRRVQLNPDDWPQSWRSRAGDRADLSELRRREAIELGERPGRPARRHRVYVPVDAELTDLSRAQLRQLLRDPDHSDDALTEIERRRPQAWPPPRTPSRPEASSSLPALLTIQYVTSDGRRLDVPAAHPDRCTHPPDEWTTHRVALGGNLRPGLVVECINGCYRGGLVGLWAWSDRSGWLPLGATRQVQGRGLAERLGLDWRRGRTEAEVAAGEGALARHATRA